MPTPRIYLDTSVLGGCFDREFAAWSRGLLQDFRARRFKPVLSELLAAEIADAPERIRQLYPQLLPFADRPVAVSTAAMDLANQYLAHRIAPARFRHDLLHIALATVASADVLVSWNFRHHVRFDKIRKFNAVNLERGYKLLAIHSPREVTT